jgi:hypothetical protein
MRFAKWVFLLDHGIDLTIITYVPEGNVENGQILVQLKATYHLKLVAGGRQRELGGSRDDTQASGREGNPGGAGV